MELKGIVTLDEETMEELREKIREEVIEDIKDSGNYSSEIREYLEDCNFKEYMSMIKCTIKQIIEKTTEDDIRFDSDRVVLTKLQVIDTILNL